jgi:hypothetical protein
MVMCRTQCRGSILTRAIASILGLTLLGTPLMKVGGQTGATPAAPTAWRGWVFARLGGASSAPVAVATSGAGVLTSLSGGVAASYGPLFGMVRVTDSQQLFDGPGVLDNAMLAGVRSRGDHLFVAGAIGIAQATPSETSDAGTATGPHQAGFAYDVSAHADFSVAGLALAISGVVGPQRTSYVAVTLGAELGWFGR